MEIAPAQLRSGSPGVSRGVAAYRLTPGRLGRCPVSQDTRHAVGPTRIIFSDSL